MARFRYITDDQLDQIFSDLNLDEFSDKRKKEIHDEAVGDLEADLVERFIVPLLAKSGGEFRDAPEYARRKVQNAFKEKIRQIVGLDQNRNLVIDSTQRFIDVHKIKYDRAIKILLDHKRQFGFKLQSFADDALVPVQSIGLARADNDLSANQLEEDFII